MEAEQDIAEILEQGAALPAVHRQWTIRVEATPRAVMAVRPLPKAAVDNQGTRNPG